MDKAVTPPPLGRKRKRSAQDDDEAGGAPAAQVQAAQAPPPPPDHHLRIYSWNVNGIQPFLQPSIASYLHHHGGRKASASRPDTPITTSLRNFLRRHHWPQLLFLQEVKINPADTASQAAVEHAVNRCRSGPDDGPRYVARFCLPRDRHNATGFGRKVYGVCTVIRQDFFDGEVEAVREVDWDAEGRVLVVETRSRLSLFNVYAVNGTTNPYKHPQTGAPAGTRHDRKLAFHAALLGEARRLEALGYRLVLGGDFNVARAPADGHPRLRTKPEQHVRNRADFNDKFFDAADGLRAVDAFRHLHPARRKYTFVPRNMDWGSSGDRIDLFVLSRGLVYTGAEDAARDEERADGVVSGAQEARADGGQRRDGEESAPPPARSGALVAAEILETEAERGPSDHVPLYVELDLARAGMALLRPLAPPGES